MVENDIFQGHRRQRQMLLTQHHLPQPHEWYYQSHLHPSKLSFGMFVLQFTCATLTSPRIMLSPQEKEGAGNVQMPSIHNTRK